MLPKLLFYARARTWRGAGEGELASGLTEHRAIVTEHGPDLNRQFGRVWERLGTS